MKNHDFYAGSMQGLPTTYINLDKRYKNSEGKYHCKLWVTFRIVREGKQAWDQQPYVTGHFLTEEDFKRMMDTDKKTKQVDLIDIRKKLQNKQAWADHLIDTYKIRDQKTFDLFFLSDNNIETIAGQYELKIKKCMAHKPKPQVSSAEKFRTSLNSLIEFSHPNLTFQEVTEDFLREYQDWYCQPYERVIKRGKDKKGQVVVVYPSVTSVGINLRHARVVFNQAIDLKIITPDTYPFGQNKFVIPEGGEESRVLLSDVERRQFLDYQPENEDDAFYYDFAVFSYFGNGINPADISSLKWNKVDDQKIIVIRQKTEGKQKKVKKIEVIIHNRMKDILRRRGVRRLPLNPEDYTFPILDRAMDAVAAFKANRAFVRCINNVLAKIAKKYDWRVRPTCYTLRHMFAGVMMENGATTEELQDMLGHAAAKTTERYKGTFNIEKKKKFSEGLG
jgi:integrase